MKRDACLALAVAVAFVGCDDATRIPGIVRDAAGQPLQGAVVTLGYEEQPRVAYADSVFTGGDGLFDVFLIHPPKNVALALTVRKLGFRSYRREFRSGSINRDSIESAGYLVTLTPVP